MARKILAAALAFILVASVAGCATESGYYSPERSAGAGALGGAATGAALGAIIGAATGSPATGAWVGAAAGGLVGGVGGWLYAEHRNSQIRQSYAAQNYNASQGNVVSVDNAYVSPSEARRGQQVTLGMNYTILTPGNSPVQVTLVRDVRFGGSALGQPYQATVTNANGSYTDEVPFTIGPNASPGTYTVINRVMSGAGTAEKVSYFVVR